MSASFASAAFAVSAFSQSAFAFDSISTTEIFGGTQGRRKPLNDDAELLDMVTMLVPFLNVMQGINHGN